MVTDPCNTRDSSAKIRKCAGHPASARTAPDYTFRRTRPQTHHARGLTIHAVRVRPCLFPGTAERQLGIPEPHPVRVRPCLFPGTAERQLGILEPHPVPYPYQSAVGTIERSPGWQPGEHDPPMEMSPVRDGRKHIQSRMPGNISIPPRTSRGLLQKHVVGPCCRTAAPPGGPAWSCHSVGAAPRGRPPLPNSIQISITWQILVILAKNTSCCFL